MPLLSDRSQKAAGRGFDLHQTRNHLRPLAEDRVDAVVRHLIFLRVPADHVAVERRRCFRIVVVPDERAACAGLIVTPLLVGGRLKSCRR